MFLAFLYGIPHRRIDGEDTAILAGLTAGHACISCAVIISIK
jgi:hypothetical protein